MSLLPNGLSKLLHPYRNVGRVSLSKISINNQQKKPSLSLQQTINPIFSLETWSFLALLLVWWFQRPKLLPDRLLKKYELSVVDKKEDNYFWKKEKQLKKNNFL